MKTIRPKYNLFYKNKEIDKESYAFLSTKRYKNQKESVL